MTEDELKAKGLRVKELVWHEGWEHGQWGCGEYDVWLENGKYQLYYWSIVLGEPHDTPEAAKDAGNKHNRARVLAALVEVG